MNLLLDPSFFKNSAPVIANNLLGKLLISRIGRKKTGGFIVETEAYLAENDAACHGTRGKTQSNAAMFGPPGHAYVYPIHNGFCFNVVVGSINQPTAVLIRAIQPCYGLPHMEARRGLEALRRLTSGPSCLCQALGIDRAMDHWNLCQRKRLWIEDFKHGENSPFQNGERQVCQTRRIGVTSAREMKLRFAVAGNPFVSGPKWMRSADGKSPASGARSVGIQR